MWTVRRVDWLARKYAVEAGKDLVGQLSFRSWSGGILLDGERLDVQREGIWSPKLHLVKKRERLATARSQGAFRRGFVMTHGSEEYHLERAGHFSHSYRLKRGERELGRFEKEGWFRHGYRIELDDELPLELRLFAVWLIVFALRAGAAAAAAAT